MKTVMCWVVGVYINVSLEGLRLKSIRVEQDVGLFLLEDTISIHLS